MITSSDHLTAPVVRVHAHHAITKHLGNWTEARSFAVRVRHGVAVIDLRGPRITDGDLGLDLDVHRGTVILLLPAHAPVDHWDLHWTGSGRVKDGESPQHPTGRRVRLAGQVHGGEVRVRRGGLAILTAMFSRAYYQDLRRAQRTGITPSVDDPARPGVNRQDSGGRTVQAGRRTGHREEAQR